MTSTEIKVTWFAVGASARDSAGVTCQGLALSADSVTRLLPSLIFFFFLWKQNRDPSIIHG